MSEAITHYWRSLEELADTPEFREFLQREFPRQASEWNDGLSRRQFLTLMGASLALAGVTGCSSGDDRETIVPYVRAPEHVVPGKPLYFATAMPLGSAAAGLLVENHMGRPTKIEGNPDHPASLGATDLFSQASILSLYDPDRSQVILKNAQIATWDAFLTEIRRELSQQRAKEGAGLRLLTQSVISPTLAAQIETLLEQYPQARWHQYEPINRDNALDGARLAFGRDVNAVYHFDQAQVVLSLESDFLDCTPQTLRYMHDFMALRRVRAADPTMNRLPAVRRRVHAKQDGRSGGPSVAASLWRDYGVDARAGAAVAGRAACRTGFIPFR
jgi:molybdopterin-containing oxidoreductase family iron-sulfur binding subunit